MKTKTINVFIHVVLLLTNGILAVFDTAALWPSRAAMALTAILALMSLVFSALPIQTPGGDL